MYWRPGSYGARHSRRTERKIDAIQDAARYVRYVRFVQGFDTRRISPDDVYAILSETDPEKGAGFAGIELAPATRTALGELNQFTLWRIARRARRGDRI